MTELATDHPSKNRKYLMPPARAIRHEGEVGILFVLGENLSKKWQSGDSIVMWSNGEYTVPPEKYDVVVKNLWSLIKDGADENRTRSQRKK